MLFTTVPLPAAIFRRRRPRAVALALFLTAFAAAARAEEPMKAPPPPGDPVAALRDILREPPGADLAARKGKITDLLNRMDLEELSRVLLIEEWRPPVSIGLKTAAQRALEDQDVTARGEARADAAALFRQKAKERMQAPAGADPATALLAKAATADLIGETAAAGRKLDYLASISAIETGAGASEGRIGYLAQQLADLTPDLIALTQPNSGPTAAADQARLSGARALGAIQPADPASVVGALEKLLTDGNERLRIAAAESMDHLAQAASDDMQRSLGRYPAIEDRYIDYARTVWSAVLRHGLAPDQPPQVRQLSLHAFGRIASEMLDTSVIPETGTPIRNIGDAKIAKELEDEANRRYGRLADAFAVVEKNAAPLAAAARDDDPEVRLAALSILGDLALVRQHLHNLTTAPPPAAAPPPPSPAGPAPSTGKETKPQASLPIDAAVVLVAADEPPAYDKSQKQALDDLAKALGRTQDSLVQQLHAPDAPTRLAALDVLEILGPAAFPSVDAITDSLRDPDRFVHWAAARTLGELAQLETDKRKFTDAQVDRAVRGIAELLRDEDVGVRLAAAVALERFGPRASPAAPILTRSINRAQTEPALRLVPTRETEPDLVTGDPTVRIAAIRALEAIDGEATIEALPEAVTALQDGNVQVRQAAADMIGRVGPKVRDETERQRLIQAVGRALGDSDGDVRRAASGALLRLLPTTKPK